MGFKMAIQKGIESWRGQVRVPKPISDWVKDQAQKNFRSMNAEIVELLRSAKDGATKNVAQ